MNLLDAKIEEVLNLFPEVIWDRFNGIAGDYQIFGWVTRVDQYLDFVIIEFANFQPVAIITSSAFYSAQFCQRLGFGHSDCQKVEDHFKFVRSVHLLEER